MQANDHKMLQVNSVHDHIHIFIGMRPTQAIAALAQNVKAETSKWIKRKGFADRISRGKKDIAHFPIQKVMCRG